MKAHSEYQNESTQLKGYMPRIYPRVSQEFGKIRILEGERM